MESIKLDNGKYEFLNNPDNAHFTCLRYGDPWRDLTGDKAVFSLFYFAQELTKAHKAQRDEIAVLKQELTKAREIIEQNHKWHEEYGNDEGVYKDVYDTEVCASSREYKSSMCADNEEAIERIKKLEVT